MRIFIAIMLFVGLFVWNELAQAECRVRVPTTHALGEMIFQEPCDEKENRYVTLGTLLKIEEGAATTLRFLSTGTNDNKFEVCDIPCQLLSMSAFSTHTAAVFVKCSEASIGSTTPGSTAIKFDFGVPGLATGGGNNSANIPPTIGLSLTALTCWIVADETDAGVVTDAPASKVRVSWSRK